MFVGIFMYSFAIVSSVVITSSECGQPYALHNPASYLVRQHPFAGNPIQLTEYNGEPQRAIPQTAYLDQPLVGPKISILTETTRSHGDSQVVVQQDHHFLTRPASFINTGPNVIRLPHPVVARPDIAMAPTSNQIGLNTNMMHFDNMEPMRPVENGASRRPIRPMVSIFAQNVMIDPRITHISMEPPRERQGVAKEQPRPLYNQPGAHPFTRRPALNASSPTAKTVPIGFPQDRVHVADQRSSLMRTDVNPETMKAPVSEGSPRTETPYQFSPLLASEITPRH